MHPNHSSKQASHAGRGPPARTPCGALHSRTTTSRRAVPATFTNPKTKNRLGAMTRRPKALRRAHQMSPGIPKTPVVLVQHDIKQAATPQTNALGSLQEQTALACHARAITNRNPARSTPGDSLHLKLPAPPGADHACLPGPRHLRTKTKNRLGAMTRRPKTFAPSSTNVPRHPKDTTGDPCAT